MYDDPTHLRRHAIKVRFDKDTIAAVEALARLHRKQKAVFLRDLVMDDLKRRTELESYENQKIGRA